MTTHTTHTAPPVQRSATSWPWRRIVAPLLLITLALIMLAMHAAHTAETGAMTSAAGHAMSAMNPAAPEATVDTGPAVIAAASTTPPGETWCGMAGCPDGLGAGGTMSLLCLTMLPGLALIVFVLLRRPRVAALFLRRRRIGTPAPDVRGPAATRPALLLRLCVLRT